MYARECTCTPLFPPPCLKSSRDQKFGRRIRYRAIFGHVRLPEIRSPSDETRRLSTRRRRGFRGKLRAARSEACSLRFERIRRSRERKKGRSRRFLLERVPRFRRRKSWRFGEGDVSRPRSFRCYIATSRCPTAFLLFTRFLVARSSRAIPSSLALRAFLRASLSSLASRLPLSRG